MGNFFSFFELFFLFYVQKPEAHLQIRMLLFQEVAKRRLERIEKEMEEAATRRHGASSPTAEGGTEEVKLKKKNIDRVEVDPSAVEDQDHEEGEDDYGEVNEAANLEGGEGRRKRKTKKRRRYRRKGRT